jgi:hypothetical protein
VGQKDEQRGRTRPGSEREDEDSEVGCGRCTIEAKVRVAVETRL